MRQPRDSVGHDLGPVAALVPWGLRDELLSGTEDDCSGDRPPEPIIAVLHAAALVLPLLCHPLREFSEALLRALACDVRLQDEAVFNFREVGLGNDLVARVQP